MAVEVKVPKKVLKVQELLHKSNQHSTEYKSISKVADGTLPPHKARWYQELVATAFFRLHKSTGEFRKAYEKLNEGDRRILVDLERSGK